MSTMCFALKLLGLRSHSRKELRQKLLKKGYTVESIEAVLEKLTLQGVLDDLMFGRELIKSRSRRKPSGKVKMHAELRKKEFLKSLSVTSSKSMRVPIFASGLLKKNLVRCMEQRMSAGKKSLQFF